MRAAKGFLFFWLCALGIAGRDAQAVPLLTVNATSNTYTINPNIYGIVNYGLDATFAKEINLPNTRWGGDGTTRYNWRVDSSNSGFDWYFIGGSGQTNPVPGAGPDTMIKAYPTAGALITIPIIPYVNSTAANTCSFPVSKYGTQQSINPYVHPNGDNCGNSLTTSGAQLTDTDILANHIANTTALQQAWVQHLVATFGTAAHGGVPFYQLDNEPLGWANTHRDVQPTPPTYATLVQLGQQYAAVVKQVDPSAAILGPSDFTQGGWIGTPSLQNGLLAPPYYLQQMAAYQQAHGVRLLDYLDEHFYPPVFPPTDAAEELNSTRLLWDPTYNSGNWVEQFYFNGPMEFLPRMQQWVTQYYPGTKIAISEYSFDSGNKTVVDALTEMDVLGIFGRQRLDFANMWNAPGATDPIAYAFRMYRNYDGAGHAFGDTSVGSASTDQTQLSVYGARRSTDGALTVMVINKTTAAISTSLALSNFTPTGAAAVYTYSNTNLKQIAVGSPVTLQSNTLTYNFPSYSATLFVFSGASAPPPPSNACDINRDDQLNVGDVQSAVNQVLGISPCGTANLQQNGVCTAVDVQRVVNAALGGSCVVGP